MTWLMKMWHLPCCTCRAEDIHGTAHVRQREAFKRIGTFVYSLALRPKLQDKDLGNGKHKNNNVAALLEPSVC